MTTNPTTTTEVPFLIPAAGSRSGDDPIFALNAEAKQRSARGEDVINATLGALLDDEGKLMLMPVVGESFAAIDRRQAAAYAPILGDPTFLGGVSSSLFHGTALAGNTVAAATPGGSGALVLAIQNFVEPGQSILVPNLFWGPYRTMAEQSGRKLATFRLFDEDGDFDLSAFDEALSREIRQQGRSLVILNFPCNNPTGFAPSRPEWDAIAEVVRRQSKRGQVVVLIDHAYAAFAPHGGDEWIAPLERCLPETLLLVAWTASKSFAQYGARVGALVAAHPDPAVRSRIQNAFGFACRGLWSNCNHLGQLAISRLLNDPALKARADQERQALVSLLGARVEAFNHSAKKAGLRYPRYEGGFFVTVFANDGARAGLRAKEDGVFVVPQSGSVRVALCSTPVSKIERLVATLKSAASA